MFCIYLIQHFQQPSADFMLHKRILLERNMKISCTFRKKIITHQLFMEYHTVTTKQSLSFLIHTNICINYSWNTITK